MRHCLYLCFFLCGWVLTPQAQSNDTTFDDQKIQAAVERLRKDPNLFSEKQTRVLHWNDRETEPATEENWQWLEDFFSAMAQTGRVLMWVLGILAAAIAVFGLKRWLALRAAQPSGRARVLPTHVRDLDIRPEHLPEDIGAAVWQHWRTAQDAMARRAALALLYRGALSRLVHVHALAIRAATTEDECVALVQEACAHRPSAMADARRRFVAHLVQVWQKAVYGGHAPNDETVHALCAGFGPALDVSVSEHMPSNEGQH